MNVQDRIVISKLRKITVISLVFMSIQFLGGYYAHSIAIFADAFHLLSDVSAYMISLYAVHKSHQPSPKTLTFGYEKVQPLGALVNVAIIWLVTFELAIEATGRILNKDIVQQPEIMLGTSVFGLLCNLYIMRVLHSDQHAGGHHGCSHSHHAHGHEELQEKGGHRHREGCQHGHGNLEVEHKKHQHTHDCHHGHGHAQSPHKDCDHEHGHHETHGTSPEEINKHAQCDHGHSHGHVEVQFSQSSIKIGDELLPATEPSQTSTLYKGSNFHNNINMQAAYIHILTDIILSLGVILSAGIIYFFAPEGHVWSYWQLADPFCTYLFSFMAIYSTIPIAKESLLYLLDGCTDQHLVAEVQRELQQQEAVDKIENLKVWSTNRGKHYGALRVRVLPGKSTKGLREIFSSRGVQGFVQLSQCSQASPLKK